MPSQKDTKSFLERTGYSREQMQAFWDELIPINATVKALHNSGFNWDSKEINITILEQLPFQKEKDLARIKEQKKKKEQELAEEEKKRQEKEYYENNFEEIMYDKITKGIPLSESELRDIVYECEEVSKVYGDKLRWVHCVTSVVLIKGKKFGIQWNEGLTEMQEDEFYNQPYEITETIDKTEKSDDNNTESDILFKIIQFKNDVCPNLIICTSTCPFYNSSSNKCNLSKADKNSIISLYNNNKERVEELLKDMGE